MGFQIYDLAIYPELGFLRLHVWPANLRRATQKKDIIHSHPRHIDVREPDEYNAGHVKGAINLPPEKLMKGAMELSGVSKETAIIVYCRSGSRSKVAMNILDQLGFTNTTNGVNKEQVEARYQL